MAAECRGCPDRKGRGLWLALLSAIFSVLLPKCPLCVVAYLSAFGVTLGVAGFALTVLRPLGFAVAAVTLAVALWRTRALRPAAATSS